MVAVVGSMVFSANRFSWASFVIRPIQDSVEMVVQSRGFYFLPYSGVVVHSLITYKLQWTKVRLQPNYSLYTIICAALNTMLLLFNIFSVMFSSSTRNRTPN